MRPAERISMFPEWAAGVVNPPAPQRGTSADTASTDPESSRA
jgi:hypothetical protein